MVSRLRVTQLYTAPTAIRMLYRYGDELVRKYDRSSLRVLGSGELGEGGERRGSVGLGEGGERRGSVGLGVVRLGDSLSVCLSVCVQWGSH